MNLPLDHHIGIMFSTLVIQVSPKAYNSKYNDAYGDEYSDDYSDGYSDDFSEAYSGLPPYLGPQFSVPITALITGVISVPSPRHCTHYCTHRIYLMQEIRYDGLCNVTWQISSKASNDVTFERVVKRFAPLCHRSR